MNARAICDFKGFSSLKGYLLRILNNRIIDNIRHENRQSAYGKNIVDKDQEMDGLGSEEASPETDLMQKEKLRLIHEALMTLADDSPTDAHLVKMHLEGLSYNQMAERLLGSQGFSQGDLDKKVNSIKKQFTRSGTGSLAKFKTCFERLMRKNNLIHDDMFN